MNRDIGLIQLASLQSLSTLNEAISKLCEQISILEDERDEYRRKWLEATKIDEKSDIKQINS
jgi:hypothetical protein